MSNFLAIATATEAFRQFLNAAVSGDVTGAVATAVRPDGEPSAAPNTPPPVGVNIYLYQTSYNAAFRNEDLPTFGSSGSLKQRPRAALDLHYLLTFYGSNELESQRVLGSVIRLLHSQPLLPDAMIDSAVSSVAELATSDLADEVENIKFTPMSLSLEELSKLWSVFFQIPYRLSVVQQASLVFIEGSETPGEALPVRRRSVFAIPFERPHIHEVTPQIVTAGGLLGVQGENLASVTHVMFGGVETTPASQRETDLSVVMPFGLTAGIQTIQLRRDLDLGGPVEPHKGYSSNVAAFALAPVISSAPATLASGTTLTLEVTPAIGSEQEVSLLISDQAVPISRSSSPPALSNQANFDIPSTFPAGDYLIRVQVDGALSPLTVDEDPLSPTFNQYVAPSLEIT